MTSERAVEPPAPREDGWEELRREIEALPPWSLGYLPPVFTPPVLVDRAAVLAIVDRLAAARGEPDEEPHGAALIPAGEPCPICGPKGHGGHEDDSYGACVLCREYVPHTDDLTVLVAWPCAPARLAAARGEPEIDVERLRTTVENVALREHSGMVRGGGIAYTTDGADTGSLDLRAIAAEYNRLKP